MKKKLTKEELRKEVKKAILEPVNLDYLDKLKNYQYKVRHDVYIEPFKYRAIVAIILTRIAKVLGLTQYGFSNLISGNETFIAGMRSTERKLNDRIFMNVITYANIDMTSEEYLVLLTYYINSVSFNNTYDVVKINSINEMKKKERRCC